MGNLRAHTGTIGCIVLKHVPWNHGNWDIFIDTTGQMQKITLVDEYWSCVDYSLQ